MFVYERRRTFWQKIFLHNNSRKFIMQLKNLTKRKIVSKFPVLLSIFSKKRWKTVMSWITSDYSFVTKKLLISGQNFLMAYRNFHTSISRFRRKTWYEQRTQFFSLFHSCFKFYFNKIDFNKTLLQYSSLSHNKKAAQQNNSNFLKSKLQVDIITRVDFWQTKRFRNRSRPIFV